MEAAIPTLNGQDDRDAKGRFGKGNRGGPGNPFAKKSNELRAAIYAGVTPEDMAAMVKALVGKAKDGDIQAFRELVPWLLGKPESMDLTERIEELETLLRESLDAQGRAVPPPAQRATA